MKYDLVGEYTGICFKLNTNNTNIFSGGGINLGKDYCIGKGKRKKLLEDIIIDYRIKEIDGDGIAYRLPSFIKNNFERRVFIKI